jgi:hypothetical protein
MTGDLIWVVRILIMLKILLRLKAKPGTLKSMGDTNVVVILMLIEILS